MQVLKISLLIHQYFLKHIKPSSETAFITSDTSEAQIKVVMGF